MIWLWMALACTGKGDDTGGDTGGDTAVTETEGTLALTFAMDPDYRDIMDEPPTGNFYGALWRDEDVTNLGPNEGATDLGGIEVDAFTVPADGVATEVLFTTGPLTGSIVVLGFLDSDANADPVDLEPDDGDPVTLPSDNKFDVVGGEETTVQVFFGLLNP